jgi:hypothetical protein
LIYVNVPARDKLEAQVAFAQLVFDLPFDLATKSIGRSA